ncbi:MAG: choice-of-anchor V domain-containing protein [Prolixibacteraceae bacterium]
MKKNIHLIILATIIAILTISGVTGTLYHSGSPGAKTGSPKDGATCTQCHTGSTVSEVNWISTTIPESGWVKNQTYTIVATAVNADAVKIGFELTAENNSTKVGTFAITNADRTKLANSNSSVTHTANGISPTNGENKWEFNWTSPETDLGDITFYAAFNAANGDGSTSGDQIFTSTITYKQEESTTAVSIAKDLNLAIYPNPAKAFVFIESPENKLVVNLFNHNGQKVKSFSNLESGLNTLDVHELKRGQYIIKAQLKDREYVQHIQLN